MSTLLFERARNDVENIIETEEKLGTRLYNNCKVSMKYLKESFDVFEFDLYDTLDYFDKAFLILKDVDKNTNTVYINSSVSKEDKRFLLGYCLGLVYSREIVAKQITSYSFMSSKIFENHAFDVNDFFAKEFACCLLMSPGNFLKDYAILKNSYLVGKKYGVSARIVDYWLGRLLKNPMGRVLV